MRSSFPPPCRATKRRGCAIAAGVVSIAMLPASAAAAADPAPPSESLSIDGEPMALPVPMRATYAHPRSLVLAAQSRITREGVDGRLVVGTRTYASPWTTSAAQPVARLEYPGRAWPFALGATADALTTQWALQRGCFERNPVLALARVDVTMVKIVQFPLLAIAVDRLERRHPRLGRTLRWATLAFHGALAFHNVRLGLAAGRASSALPASAPSGQTR